jgi:hypothetical protein
MRPNIWRLLLGYAPPNADRREGVLTRKRLEYVECVSQYYDIPDTERSDEEINMLRQVSPDFFDFEFAFLGSPIVHVINYINSWFHL